VDQRRVAVTEQPSARLVARQVPEEPRKHHLVQIAQGGQLQTSVSRTTHEVPIGSQADEQPRDESNDEGQAAESRPAGGTLGSRTLSHAELSPRNALSLTNWAMLTLIEVMI